jgi:hypothetical protein
MAHAAKWSFIQTMLPSLTEPRYGYGTPQRIILDEAHHFLNDSDHLLDFELAGYTLITYEPSRLHPDVLAASEAVITTRLTDPREKSVLATCCAKPGEQTSIARLEFGQAAILPAVSEAAGTLTVFRAGDDWLRTFGIGISILTCRYRLSAHSFHCEYDADRQTSIEFAGVSQHCRS